MLDILLVEDSLVLARLLTRRLSVGDLFRVTHVTTREQAAATLNAGERRFFLAILDLVLPDAREGEVVDTVMAHGIPVVVFTALVNDDTRDFLESKGIVDYVVKQAKNVERVAALVERLARNREFPVLLVEDSRTQRAATRRLLELYMFPVLEAENGVAAIRLLSEHKDVKLVITDYLMPEMDGFELLAWLRNEQDHDPNTTAVIGISSHGSNTLSARFIKEGGNDFLAKPFLKEEFICRVLQNVQNLESHLLIRETAQTDFLTGLSNRRHFDELAAPLYNNAKRRNLALTLAMVDIDHFKKVNDSYGHYAGDLVLKAVGNLLQRTFRKSDVVARMGGEEFCILAANVNPAWMVETFDRFRREVEALEVPFANILIRVTISMGITTRLDDSLEGMVGRADTLLYRAKRNGRNRLELELEETADTSPAPVG